jgi:hypothetical protein
VCGSFGDLAVRLCFGIWVDVGVGFSFGGVVSLLWIFKVTWMLVCCCGLVEDGVGCVSLKAFETVDS